WMTFWRIEAKSRSASASVWLPIGTTLPVSKDNAGHNRSIRFSGRRMDQTESGLGGSTTAHSSTQRIGLAWWNYFVAGWERATTKFAFKLCVATSTSCADLDCANC